MYRFLLKPKWLAFHLLIIVLVVVMVNLGIWQLHRLQSRRAFNDEVRSRAGLPTLPIDQVVTPQIRTVDDGDLVEWRAVTVEGTYLADQQVLIVNQSQDGVPGQDVVTPLRLADGDLLLVNRGFVPESDTAPAPPGGTVTVLGRVRTTEKRTFGGLSDPAEGHLTELHRLDIERMAKQLPAPVLPVSIDLVRSQPSAPSDPAPIPPPELTEGPHLSYMIQWWIFSACAVVGWVLAVRRSAQKPAEAPVPPAAGAAPPATS
jgi:cytochrome oxidase assembly protein ShyY1